jgi:hypothetical protein
MITISDSNDYNAARNRADWLSLSNEQKNSSFILAWDELRFDQALQSLPENPEDDERVKSALFELCYFRLNNKIESIPENLASVSSSKYSETYKSRSELSERKKAFPNYPDIVINLLAPFHKKKNLKLKLAT